MARPTTIRSLKIGNKLGTVVTITVPFRAWFQLYQVPAAELDNPGGPFLMIREDEFDNEREAVELFEAWKKEAELLLAAGDM